ncbi:MAG: MAPEG family protein [Myxococcales bacterium]|nr:MAPEG family protein [Myxococcales bacterium]
MPSIASQLNIDIATLTGPIVVTMVYLALYYAFMINILRVKGQRAQVAKDKGEKFDRYFGQDREMLAADRVQLNMLEHMPVFLTLLWLHAFVVSPVEATWLGGAYTLARAAYPVALGSRMGRRTPVRILPFTGLGYGIILAFVVRILMQL